MSNVNLEIGGRTFSVASADGEEAHVVTLGRKIDEKLRAMGGAAGQSESRMLLFAALLLADEIHEMTQRGGHPAPPDNSAELERIARVIEDAAARVDALAETLENAAA
jgi:cell division protein ZapA